MVRIMVVSLKGTDSFLVIVPKTCISSADKYRALTMLKALC